MSKLEASLDSLTFDRRAVATGQVFVQVRELRACPPWFPVLSSTLLRAPLPSTTCSDRDTALFVHPTKGQPVGGPPHPSMGAHQDHGVPSLLP